MNNNSVQIMINQETSALLKEMENQLETLINSYERRSEDLSLSKAIDVTLPWIKRRLTRLATKYGRNPPGSDRDNEIIVGEIIKALRRIDNKRQRNKANNTVKRAAFILNTLNSNNFARKNKEAIAAGYNGVSRYIKLEKATNNKNMVNAAKTLQKMSTNK